MAVSKVGRIAAIALSTLACMACQRTRAATYRWGGRGANSGYLVDMGTVKRAGTSVSFDTVFVPLATKEKPELSDMYVRAQQWVDCARSLQSEKGQQVYTTSGMRVPTSSDADAHPTPSEPGSTWASVRDLVCTGKNDLKTAPLSGTDVQVVAQARAYMAAHPVGE